MLKDKIPSANYTLDAVLSKFHKFFYKTLWNSRVTCIKSIKQKLD
ncbi:hypothetical protein FHS68_002817 [Dyadobacter arcticus]|uniref:Uncharacterized protein n=1 Tax=Dyadobacter arcticus TaxID=1078754 RepID=A0ABX0UPM4_9BACT|nr:hypothetical protein [Dyadobacter arcticus]